MELNPNLPELKNFHTMQKLQMEISANFERDHERFKKLVRDSMLLAGKIKRDLELDWVIVIIVSYEYAENLSIWQIIEDWFLHQKKIFGRWL